jgi:hypothetical protein
MIEHLFEERFGAFFTTLTAWTLAREALTYFENNRGRLGYKACGDAGLPIGSGMVEGGVRFVGKDRLDKTGMRWSVPDLRFWTAVVRSTYTEHRRKFRNMDDLRPLCRQAVSRPFQMEP